MVRKVWYEAIDPYYSDIIQTFVGTTWEDLDNQEYEHDKYLGREHSAGIVFIYDKYTIYESDCVEWETEANQCNYKRYLEKMKSNGSKTV